MADQTVTQSETAGQMPSLLPPNFEQAVDIGITRLPEQYREGLFNYLRYGVPPGGFLMAVLTNDLLRACLTADDDHRLLLHVFVAVLYNDAPSDAWGTPEKVQAWIKAGGDLRRTWLEGQQS